MRTVAVYNIKGGVGKTAAAVHLSYASARAGWRTLLWDLDPQGAATYTFRIEAHLPGGVRRLLAGLEREDPVRGSDFEHLDVLPAEFACRKLDRVLAEREGRERGLSGVLAGVAAGYEHVILDCAPGIGALAEAVFDAADVLVVPTIPTTLSLRTLAQLMKHLKKREERGRRRPLVLPFFSMVDARKRMHRTVCTYAEAHALGFLKSRIPYASSVERASAERAPVHVIERRGGAALAYDELWNEVLERLRAGERAASTSMREARALLEQVPTNGAGG